MRIAGVQMNSMVDYPGCISAVLFTQGCNMDCFYCHNRTLLSPKATKLYDPDAILVDLEKRKFLIDAVVLSGGEPTLQPDLPSYIRRMKELGFKIKLDTNGTHPLLLYGLIQDGLLDYVAMDIKAPMEKYRYICGTHVPMKAILKSIDILLAGSVDYEFRTTFVPQLDQEDIQKIAEGIRGAKRYFLQQYKKPPGSKDFKDDRIASLPHPPADLLQMIQTIKILIPTGKTRGA